MPAGCQSKKTLALQIGQSSAVVTFILKLDQFRPWPETYPGGAATAALRRANSSDPKGSIYYCRSAWPMMSQQFSHEPDTRSRPSASPSVRMLPVYRRPAGDFISGTSLHSYERPVPMAGLFSYKTRLRRGAQLTWQTKCLSTPPTKRRHA